MLIEDGRGTGIKAHVDSENRLQVRSFSESIQHSVSHQEGQAYQVLGTATLASGTTTALCLTNNSTSRDVVVTYIRHQILDSAGGTDFPNADNYFKVRLGCTYNSGGTVASVVNLNTNSANLAEVTAYHDNPSVNSTLTKEIDRWYTKDNGDMNTLNKEGSVVLGQGGTITLEYVGDKTSGIIYSRLSFIMMDKH